MFWISRMTFLRCLLSLPKNYSSLNIDHKNDVAIEHAIINDEGFESNGV